MDERSDTSLHSFYVRYLLEHNVVPKNSELGLLLRYYCENVAIPGDDPEEFTYTSIAALYSPECLFDPVNDTRKTTDRILRKFREICSDANVSTANRLNALLFRFRVDEDVRFCRLAKKNLDELGVRYEKYPPRDWARDVSRFFDASRNRIRFGDDSGNAAGKMHAMCLGELFKLQRQKAEASAGRARLDVYSLFEDSRRILASTSKVRCEILRLSLNVSVTGVAFSDSDKAIFHSKNGCDSTIKLTFRIPFLRSSLKYWTHFLRDVAPRVGVVQTSGVQHHFDSSRLQELRSCLLALWTASGGRRVDTSLADKLERFCDDESSDPCPSASKLFGTRFASARSRRLVLTGVACCGKTSLLRRACADNCGAIEIRSRGECGGFPDKDTNPASVAGMHAALETHFANDAALPVGDRGQFDNSLWRAIMLVCDETDAESAIDILMEFFSLHQNPASIAYFRSFKTFVTLESDVMANRVRMLRRKESTDVARAEINGYVRAQSIAYFAMAVWFRYRVRFVRYVEPRLLEEEKTAEPAMDIDRLYKDMCSYFFTPKLTTGFESVVGYSTTELERDLKKYEYARNVGIYK